MSTAPRRRAPATTLDPKVFIEAARLIGQGEALTCCVAIDNALEVGDRTEPSLFDTPYHHFLNSVLRPEGGDNHAWYRWGWEDYPGGYPGENVYFARTLGLLLLAELLKDGSADTFLPRPR